MGNGTSVLDYILVNWDNLDSVNYLDVLPLGLSDHFPVALHVKSCVEAESQSANCRTVINVSSTEKFTTRKAPTNKPEADVDELNHCFISALTSAAASIGFIKKKVSRRLNDKPWFNYECRESMKMLRSLARAISKKKPRDDDSIQELKRARSQFKLLLNEKKKMYYNRIETTLNESQCPKEYWNAVKCLRSKKSNDNPLKPQDRR